MATGPSPLAALAQLITAGVQTIEAAYAKQGIPYPSLDAPFQPTPLDFDPALFQTAHLIVAAASQLIATVRSPMETIQAYAASMHVTSTLGFVVDADIPDVLKDAGPQGLHARVGNNFENSSSYFALAARVLRFLATRHVFTEVAPNTFANNRISSLLIKAKSLEEIKADPEAKYDGAPVAAIAASTQSSGYLSEFLRTPSGDVSPFNTAFKTPKTMWEWREEPHNIWRARRFAVGMKGGGDMFPASIFTEGVGGDKLPADALVVDVGGSIGSVTLKIAKDLQKEITEGEKFWASSAPDLISSGRVQLQVHNFFEPQSVKDAAVYFMRVVIHDWPDAPAKEIMANTRKAAGPNSKLVLFDLVMPYACATPGSPPTPFPLLSNLGVAGAGFVTGLDIEMMTVFNGKERTVDEFRALGEATGWKLEEVKPGMLFGFVYSAV
ncbi:S-adenosyl-L-methionine-dependent methyltransferase [Mycena alexandri]|uniref:S-adenosyl-L-methionine-dependent methyltransferase n=1 Tax=Mycena alexandri TaxID=1745969 RepID=A0AAD6SEG6_9AGAR|nr:S-adenosyl-L-methionine-dependent methyltransferase [Mycena alexandri]